MTPKIKLRIDQIRRGEIPKGYIRTVSGISPTDWKRYTFGDIYTERKEPGSEELPLLMVSIHSGVSDGEVDEEDLPKKVKRIADKSQYKKAVSGDLVFNMMRAWQGAIGTVRTTGMVSPAYIVAEPNDTVYPLFMDYYTRTPQMINQIDRQSYGVTDFRKRLYWDSFIPIGCILPPVAEQQKIAAILTTQDKVIELKEKRLAQKQRQKKYLMQQLLTGKKRLPGFSEEWKIKPLKKLTEKQRKKNNGFQYRLILSNSAQHGIVSQDQEFDKEIANEERIDGYYIVIPGAFVYNPRISVTAPCGPINVNETGETGIMSPLYTVFTISSPQISQDFLKYYFQSSCWYKYVKGVANYGARHDRISISDGDFFDMPIPLPTKEEQNYIAKVLSAVDREIELLQQDIEQEKEKKKALMQLLLTGIVRVNA